MTDNNYLIVDAHGKTVLTGNIKRSVETINISKLSAGNYMLMISDHEGWIRSKFIKQ